MQLSLFLAFGSSKAASKGGEASCGKACGLQTPKCFEMLLTLLI
jgi:hypothetical protein